MKTKLPRDPKTPKIAKTEGFLKRYDSAVNPPRGSKVAKVGGPRTVNGALEGSQRQRQEGGPYAAPRPRITGSMPSIQVQRKKRK